MMNRLYLTIPIILFLMSNLACGSGPDNVVKQFMEHSANANLTEAKELSTGEVYDLLLLGEEMFAGKGGDFSKFFENCTGCTWKELLTNMNVVVKEQIGQRATVNVETGKVTLTCLLVTVGDRWKIYDIRIPAKGSITNVMKT